MWGWRLYHNLLRIQYHRENHRTLRDWENHSQVLLYYCHLLNLNHRSLWNKHFYRNMLHLHCDLWFCEKFANKIQCNFKKKTRKEWKYKKNDKRKKCTHIIQNNQNKQKIQKNVHWKFKWKMKYSASFFLNTNIYNEWFFKVDKFVHIGVMRQFQNGQWTNITKKSKNVWQKNDDRLEQKKNVSNFNIFFSTINIPELSRFVSLGAGEVCLPSAPISAHSSNNAESCTQSINPPSSICVFCGSLSTWMAFIRMLIRRGFNCMNVITLKLNESFSYLI